MAAKPPPQLPSLAVNRLEALSESSVRSLLSDQIDRSRDHPNPASSPSVVNLVLENTNLGRGRYWHDEVERRSFEILTESVVVSRLARDGSSLVECARRECGELCSSFTYVIRWRYKVNAVGFGRVRFGAGDESSSSLSKSHSRTQVVTGRDRHALFVWHGERSSQNEKGTSALLTLDPNALACGACGLVDAQDEQQATTTTTTTTTSKTMPHVQVFQFKEPAAFCQLFDGSMLVLAAETTSGDQDENAWRMFELRGDVREESHLVELERPARAAHLRSRTSFVFVNKRRAALLVWHGCMSSDNQRQLVVQCAHKLLKRFGHLSRFS